ncbi:hypothetical protein MMC18_005065 [Xylographa bjoerkii]|nr:hypothetical protein [Xylographa bjoerkii]
MATGVEIAGFVLAALPLVISGLEHYAEGVETIERWWRYQREFAATKRLLAAEQIILEGTCERLLNGLVTELDELINHPGGSGWKDPELDKKLQRRLGRAYNSFMECVENMASIMKELKEKLELSSEGELLALDETAFKKQLKRMRFSISQKQYDEALRKLENYNSVLSTLVTQNQELEPLRKRRSKSKVEFKTIQYQAKNLYTAIKTRWACKCNAPHHANLRLDARLLDSQATKYSYPDESDGVKSGSDGNGVTQFGVIFVANDPGTVTWSCKETQIRILDRFIGGMGKNEAVGNGHKHSLSVPRAESASPPVKEKKKFGLRSIFSSKSKSTSSVPTNSRKGIKFADQVTSGSSSTNTSINSEPVMNPLVKDTTEIRNFCSMFANGRSVTSSEKECLGYLPFDETRILAVYPAVNQPSLTLSKSAFLTQLLSKGQGPAATSDNNTTMFLSRGDRFLLALILSSSVLQLCQTPWLQDNWNRDDIIIDASSTSTLDLRQRVFVSKCFPEEAASSLATRRAQFFGLRNQTLFTLGLVLIELCLGQTLDSLREPQDPLGQDGMANVLTDWSTATRLMLKVAQEAGNRYSDAVRRCIYCDFDQRSSNLENDAFRQAVYEGVVLPLEEIFQDFNML